MECDKCGAHASELQATCEFCGNRLVVAAAPVRRQPVPVMRDDHQSGAPAECTASRPAERAAREEAIAAHLAIPGYALFKPYYQQQFEKMFQSQEVYKGKWNWAAFFFSWIWCFTKGLWLSGIIWLLLSVLTSGTLGLIAPFYYAVRGNYLIYRMTMTNKQPWI
jgi:hypothetical protein